jgi:hypothetical protein
MMPLVQRSVRIVALLTAGPSVAATLTGVVTRADNGSPVAGARVLAAVADPFSIAAFGVTGAGGTFTLTVPAGT